MASPKIGIRGNTAAARIAFLTPSSGRSTMGRSAPAAEPAMEAK